MGLKDEMLKAKTIDQVNSLFAQGSSFEKPSAKTVRKWEKVKALMIEKLTPKPKVVKQEVEKDESPKKEKKTKKNK